MDTVAFIVALLIIVVIGFWYVENEMKGSDGAHGLLAIEAAKKSTTSRASRHAEGAGAWRYRARGAKATTPADSAPKYRRKERAWDRAAKLDDGD